MIRPLLLFVVAAVAAPAIGETLSPDLQDFFESIGFELDADGNPVPPPPIVPPTPSVPQTDAEVRAILAQLGIELDENGEPIVPEPVTRPNPTPPTDPRELFEQLGLDPALLETGPEPTPVVVVPVPEPAPLVETPQPTTLPPELIELLGLGDPEDGLATPPMTPAVEPIEPIDAEDLWNLLGIADPTISTAASSAATSVPEPASAVLVTLAGLFAGTSRRRR